jgi:hypothetical protein
MSGRCVAGKELIGGAISQWIRPVSARSSHELSEEERRFENGQDPQLLDLVIVPLDRHEPRSYQTENHVIDDNYYWALKGRANATQLQTCLDPVTGTLWGADSTYHGVNDRVEEAVANAMTESLKLVQVQDLKIQVSVEGANFGNGKRKVRGGFTLGKTPYLLTVTDPKIERKYLAQKDGTTAVGAAILCISLSEIFQGAAYKLIAGVILPSDVSSM